MQKISRILIPFNFSKSAQRALEYAIHFVGQSEIEITLLHISEGDNNINLESKYDEIAKKYSTQLRIPIQWVFAEGDLINMIDTTANKVDCELIMMGTHSLSETKQITNTAKLVSKTKATVLVVPDKTPNDIIKKITFVLGKNKIKQPEALETLLVIARKFNATVNVLTVKNTDEIYGYSETDKENESILEYYLEHFYKNHTYVKNQDIVEGIFSYTRDNDTDMIVILPKHHVKSDTLSESKLTKELVMKSKLPILTI